MGRCSIVDKSSAYKRQGIGVQNPVEARIYICKFYVLFLWLNKPRFGANLKKIWNILLTPWRISITDPTPWLGKTDLGVGFSHLMWKSTSFCIQCSFTTFNLAYQEGGSKLFSRTFNMPSQIFLCWSIIK